MPNTFPLTPDQNLLSKLTNFPESVYSLLPSDYLYKFMLAILGPAGAGQFALVQDTARNTQTLNETLYSDLDSIFGESFSIPRLTSEEYAQSVNPFVDMLTTSQWENVNYQDSLYRERIKYVLQAIQKGGTLLGMGLLAEALTGYNFIAIPGWKLSSTNLMNFPDATFSGATGTNWTSLGLTSFYPTTKFFLSGGYSLLMESVNGTSCGVVSPYYPITAGDTYSFMIYVSPEGSPLRNVTLTATWFSSGGVTTGTPATITTAEISSFGWTQLLIQGIAAPTGATLVNLTVSVAGIPTGETHYAAQAGIFSGSVSQWTLPNLARFPSLTNEFILLPLLPGGMPGLPVSSLQALYSGVITTIKPASTIPTIATGVINSSILPIRDACADSEWFSLERSVTAPSSVLASSNSSNSRNWLQPDIPTNAPTFSHLNIQHSNLNLNNNIGSINVSIYDNSIAHSVTPITTPVQNTQWSAWTSFGLADSPDNYPSGKYPGDASKYTLTVPPVYIYAWPSQSAYISYLTNWILSQGGQVSGSLYRLPILDNYQPQSNSQNTDMLMPSSTVLYATIFGGL